MEDLFMNFADHLSHIISPALGNQVKQYLRRRLSRNSNPEEYINIENEIKSIMTNYFENASDKDYLDMSANLYNSYVEYDDENFIKSIRSIEIKSSYQNVIIDFDDYPELKPVAEKLCDYLDQEGIKKIIEII